MESVRLLGNGVLVNEEEKRRIIDLHLNQGKTIREVCRIMGKSSHDITPVTKEYRIQLAQNYALANEEHGDVVQPDKIYHKPFTIISISKSRRSLDSTGRKTEEP
jgi:transposase-like protein